ncbi:hypothetical protein [Cupriavidus necator]|uniref:hypothetical protein n=1 Tax=Cupriavidus necator TaxID=106590 RepID=UPI0005B513C4|nr:hypothetical protein [Cupriavidus necator]
MNEPDAAVLDLVEQSIEAARRLGVSWDEAVEAFGLAAKALAVAAAKADAGSEVARIELARMNLEAGFSKAVETKVLRNGSYAYH